MTNNDEERQKVKNGWDKAEICAKLIGSVLIPLVVLIGTYEINNTFKKRDANIKMVELALQVLREKEPKTEPAKQLREWAVRTINENSSIPLPKQSQEELLREQLVQSQALPFMGYAHVELVSNPPGAYVHLEPTQFPEIQIPASGKTPAEMNVLAGEYKVVFRLGEQTRTEVAAIYYNRNNRISVDFR